MSHLSPAGPGRSSHSHLREHQQLLNQNRYAASIIFKTLDRLLSIESVLDLGCGIGTWMEAALTKPGREVVGIDLEKFAPNELLVPPPAIINTTLELPVDLHRRFDLTLCLETAEHIAAESAPALVSNCVRHSDVVLFSAAIPGQGGLAHVNEQPPDYWQGLFDQAGYAVLDIIRPLIWYDLKIPAWYRQNILLFVNRKASATIEFLRSEANGTPMPLHRAHPDLFQWQARELARYRAQLEQQNSEYLQAELRAAELQTDLAAQGDFSGRVLSEVWGLVNKIRCEREMDRSRLQVAESDRNTLVGHLAALQSKLAGSERDRADLRSSLSWRVTAPLRVLGELLLRLRKH